MRKQRFIDTWITNNYRICSESEVKQFQNESAFQSIYANINNSKLSPRILCVIEGRWSKDNAESVNGRFYGKFWRKQLAKEQTQFLLRKGLMYMMFGHVDRGIEDKDVEDGTVAGIVTHLQVIEQPTEINGRVYEKDDLFGRAIIVEMGGKNAGASTYTLLSVGSEISISSRGLGEYIIGETHTCEDGRQIPIMNPDTYELETFDFTRLPGISDAEVHMVRDNNESVESEEDDFGFDNESIEVSEDAKRLINESVETLIFNITKKETNDMANVDVRKLQKVLEDANAKIASLSAENDDLKKDIQSAEEEKDKAVAKAEELEKKLSDKEEKPEVNETIEAGVEPQEPIEDPAPVKDEVTKEEPAPNEVDMTELAEFKEIADSPKELQDTLATVQETLQQCKEDAEELEKVKAENEELKAKLAEKEDEVQECGKVLESYVALGTIDELNQMVESNRKLEAAAREQKLTAFVEHFSVKKGITQESIKKIIDSSKSFKAARVVLESLPNVKPDKGLYKGSSETKQNDVTPEFKTFAESFITKSENRRTKSYTV